jgi:starch phosphorylase
MEASGTGNMKFALNGALTIGTLDGANIEIRDRVGPENIIIFGLTSDEVDERRRNGIDAGTAIAASPALTEALDAVGSGVFSPDDSARYGGLVDGLRHHDHFMVAGDFEAYRRAHDAIATLWRDPAQWWQKAILNTAGIGWFSADRAIREYARDIWRIEPNRN